MPDRRIESSSEPVVGDAEASSPAEGPIDALAYVTAEKAWLYRRRGADSRITSHPRCRRPTDAQRAEPRLPVGGLVPVATCGLV